MESLATKTPLVATPVGMIQDYINNLSFISKNFNAEELANLCLDVYSLSDEDLQSYKRKSYKMSSNFTYKNNVILWKNCYIIKFLLMFTKNNLQKLQISVIGLGYVGLPLAVSLSKYFLTKGFDIDKSKIDNLNKNIDINKQFTKLELRKKKFSFLQIFTILKIQIYL